MSAREKVTVEQIRHALRELLESASLIDIAVDVSTGYAEQHSGAVNQDFENIVALVNVIGRKVDVARRTLDELETQFTEHVTA